MTTGNTVAVTVSQASMAQAPAESDCQELEQRNGEKRNVVEEGSDNKQLRSKNGLDQQEGTTISSCKFQAGGGGGPASCASAHSHREAHRLFPDEFIEGGDKETTRSGKAPVMCSEDQLHRPPYKQKSGHAEARILDALGSQKGLKLVFKIDWRPSEGGESNLPCEDCHRLLCIAMSECKHEIWLCDNANKPQKLTERECGLDEKGNVGKTARDSLKKKMRARRPQPPR